MGAWSHESFDNDDALDWVDELDECTDLGLVESTFDQLLVMGNEMVEAPDACKAIWQSFGKNQKRTVTGVLPFRSERADAILRCRPPRLRLGS